MQAMSYGATARSSLEALLLPAPISESHGPNAEPNEIWMSVFGGIFVCVAVAIMMMLTQAKVDREGERGRARRKERAHDRFRVKTNF